MNIETLNEQEKTLLLLRGAIASMPAEQKTQYDPIAAKIAALVDEASQSCAQGEAMLMLALSIAVLEITTRTL